MGRLRLMLPFLLTAVGGVLMLAGLWLIEPLAVLVVVGAALVTVGLLMEV